MYEKLVRNNIQNIIKENKYVKIFIFLLTNVIYCYIIHITVKGHL